MLDANPAFVNMLGYLDKEELLSLNHLDLYQAPGGERLEKKLQVEHGVKDFLVGVKRKNGTTFPAAVNITAFRDETGAPLCYDGIVEDITDRRNAEHEREHLLRDMAERVKEIRCMYQVAEIARESAELDEIFRKTADLLPGAWQFPEVACARILFDDLEYASNGFKESPWRQRSLTSVSGSERGRVDVYYLEERPQADAGPFLKEEQGLLDGIARTLAVAVNQREAEASREASEKALRASEERYRMIFEGSVEGIVIMDVETTAFKYANAALMAMFGYEQMDELAQRKLMDMHPEAVWPKLNEIMAAELRGEHGPHRDIPCKRKNGTEFRADISTNRLIIDGRPCIAGFFVDMTKIGELEEQLRQSQKLEAIGQMAGGIAHDFNNLLSPILGYSDLVLSSLGPDSPDAKDVEQIRQAGERAAVLTQQLLAFSRKQTLQFQILDINEAVRNIEKMLLNLITENINLRIELSDQLGQVEADPGQIDQVIINLVLNARDAMPRGGNITIENRQR